MLLRSQRTFILIAGWSLLFIVIGVLAYFAELGSPLLWLLLLIVGLFGATGAYYWRVYGVFGKILEQVEALMAGGKYKKIFLPRNDEFGLLAKFFNHVTKNLEGVSHRLKEGDRMTQELDLAAEIQKSVVPKSIPGIDKLDVAARTRPADEVGGDSFGFMEKSGQTYMYLGDVTGHGAPAGLIMMMVNTLLAVYLPAVQDTKQWLTEVNRVLKPRVNSTMFMTTIALRWDPTAEQMFYTGAGHEHLLIYRAQEGVCEAITTGGIALGMADDISEIAQEKQVEMAKGDIIVLYTDGIPEARNRGGEMYTLERLKQAVAKNGSVGNAQGLFEKIAEDFRAFVGEEPQLDDITLIVLHYNGLPVNADQAGLLVNTAWGESTK